jgi:hypothetical protein
MATDSEIHEALLELFSVANAPLTPPQREKRGQPAFDALGMSAAEVVRTLRQPELPWNKHRADALGVSAETWQGALTAAGIDGVSNLAGLLDTMHRAVAAAEMLKAGYKPVKDAAGKPGWAK